MRCENTARLLLRTLGARSDARVWTHARQICRDLGAVAADGEVFDALRTRDSQGLQADVKHLAWCASQVRNRLSARYWRGVVGLQRQMQEAMATRGSSREVYERVLLSLAALTGFSEEDMMHDEGWRVMRLGRRIERMQFVANILVRQLEERARHAARDRRVAARRLRQHAYLPRALPRRSAPLADAEPAAVRRRASDGAGVPPAVHRSRPRRPGARPRGRARTRRARCAAAAARRRPNCWTPQGEEGDAARAELAEELDDLSARSAELSDRLSRRYFALIESDAQALAT